MKLTRRERQLLDEIETDLRGDPAFVHRLELVEFDAPPGLGPRPGLEPGDGGGHGPGLSAPVYDPQCFPRDPVTLGAERALRWALFLAVVTIFVVVSLHRVGPVASCLQPPPPASESAIAGADPNRFAEPVALGSEPGVTSAGCPTRASVIADTRGKAPSAAHPE